MEQSDTGKTDGGSKRKKEEKKDAEVKRKRISSNEWSQRCDGKEY